VSKKQKSINRKGHKGYKQRSQRNGSMTGAVEKVLSHSVAPKSPFGSAQGPLKGTL